MTGTGRHRQKRHPEGRGPLSPPTIPPPGLLRRLRPLGLLNVPDSPRARSSRQHPAGGRPPPAVPQPRGRRRTGQRLRQDAHPPLAAAALAPALAAQAAAHGPRAPGPAPRPARSARHSPGAAPAPPAATCRPAPARTELGGCRGCGGCGSACPRRGGRGSARPLVSGRGRAEGGSGGGRGGR